MIRTLIKNTKELILSLIHSMEESYTILFKGAVILLGVSLAGLLQSYPHITKFDYDARKIQYEIEAVTGVNISKVDCNSIKTKKAECNLAQYQLQANKSAMNLASFIITTCGYFGFFLMYLSVQGFICKASRLHDKKI